MSILQAVSPMPKRNLEGTSFNLIDADTAVNSETGESYRLPDVDAPEIEKFVGTEDYTAGDPGGEATTQAVFDLMNKLGYKNPKPRLDENGEIMMDEGGSRIVADWYNDEGENFVNRGIYEGIYKPSPWTTDNQDALALLGQLEREREQYSADGPGPKDDWDLARDMIQDALQKEGYKQFGLKRTAENEAELAAAEEAGVLDYYHEHSVETRHYDRTLNNVALNPWSDNFDKALIGVQEATAGLKNMWGEATNNEVLAEVGRLGVERNQQRLLQYGTSIIDWKDVDSFGDGIDYVMNNAAMSLPYMAIAGASVAAAPLVGTAAGFLGAGSLLTGGITLAAGMAAPAAIYASQTWNEMEGKKNMSVAVGSGILQSALERLGIEYIFKGGNLVPKTILNNAVNTIMKKGVRQANGTFLKVASRAEAEKLVGNATRKSILEYVDDAAKVAKAQIAGKQIVKSFAKRAVRGGTGEAFTEGMQEAIGYTAATLGSDKTFDYTELADRMIAGAVAGWTLGTGFSVPGAALDTGAWADLAVRKLPAEAKRLSKEGARAEAERIENGQLAYDYEKGQAIEEFVKNENYNPDEKSKKRTARDLEIDNEIELRAEAAREANTRVQSVEERYEEERKWVEATRNYDIDTTNPKKSKEQYNAEKDKHKIESAKPNYVGPKKFDSFEEWKKKRREVKVRGIPTQVTRSDITDLQQRKAEHQAVPKDRSLRGVLESTLDGGVKLVRKLTRTILNQDQRDGSRAADTLGAGMDSEHSRNASGRDLETYKFNLVSMYKNMVTIPKNFYAVMNNNKIVSRSKKAQISKQVYALLRSIISKDKKSYDVSKLPMDGETVKLVDPVSGETITFVMKGRDAIIKLANELKSLSDEMYKRQKVFNPDLGYIDNYLFKFKSLSKEAIAQDREKFEALLVQEYKKITPQIARELTDRILDNDVVNSIDDVLDEGFSVVKGGIVPGSHRKRSLAMSENSLFDDFMEQDLFANVSNAVKSAARYETHRKFIGKNGEILASLLDKMEYDDGMSRREVNEIADRYMKYLDAESGNYERPTSDAGKKAVAIQKNIMFLATFAMLGLATVASLVEIALSGRALTADQIYGRKGSTTGRTSLHSWGKELGKTLADLMGFTGEAVTWQEKGIQKESPGQEKIRKLGYYEWDVGAATVTGVSEVNPLHQKWYEMFFKMTGLTGWTNMTRAMRASIANDYMFDHATKIAKFRQMQKGDPELVKNNDIQESEESLRNLGMNVDDIVPLYLKMDMGMPLEPEEQAMFEDQIRTGTFNFINDAVALPTVGNRPLIYQDPRFALFTQFQGFIATFSANHIPKLWSQYIQRGTPSMKYNAFALMTTMIMLGFASQYLKDLIKYGGSGKQMKTAGNPYLDTSEYIQRGIRSSGLLGVSERALDVVFPIYDEKRTDGPLEWGWQQFSGEAPAAGIINRGARAAGKVVEGDFAGAAQQISKITPVIGVAGGERLIQVGSDAASGIGNLVSDAKKNIPSWNFKGE